MEHTHTICDVASHIIANPHAEKRPFSRIVHHTQTCAVCDPKSIAASIANTVFSPRLLKKLQYA